MAERYLELHSEFRDRYILFHLADGSVRDSRLINWRRVEWEKVIKLEARLRGHAHIVDCSGPGFQFFLNFKTVQIGKGPDLATIRRLFWEIGWTNGDSCFMHRINFKTGLLEHRYRIRLTQIPGHIHPRVQGMVAGNVPGTKTQEVLGY